jgi:hypothetical protein
MKYNKITTDMGQEFIVRDNGDNTNSFIPLSEDNADYQEYLSWLKEQD